MAEQTEFLDLVQPAGGEAVEVRVINENMDKIDEWAATVGSQGTRARAFKGPTTDRATIVPTPGVGDTYLETDGDRRLWEFDGANWLSASNGLYLITPTAVSGTGVSKVNGRVVAAAANEIIIDGVFTSRFRRYLVVIDIDSASVAGVVNAQFRAAAATLAGNYVAQTSYNSSDTTFVTSKSPASNEFQIGMGSGTGPREITLELSNPAAATPTILTGRNAVLLGAHHLLGDFFVRRSTAGAVDGLRIFPPSGTLSGTVSVFGRP